jgi:hypothetical protein
MRALTLSAAVHQLVIIGGMAPAEFASLVGAFGPLPEDGIHELAQSMLASVGLYRLQQSCRSRRKGTSPAKESEQLERIASQTRHLLASMGIKDSQAIGLNPKQAPALMNPPAQQWLFVEMYKVANERRPTTATLVANARMELLLVLLSDLVAAADRCAVSARQQSIRGGGRGRGGKGREGPTPEVTLLYALFDTYATLRRQYTPNNGPMPKTPDPSLSAFVRAGLALAVSLPPAIVAADGTTYRSAEKIYGGRDLAKRITDRAIGGAFYRWRKSQSTVRKAIDLRITPTDKT